MDRLKEIEARKSEIKSQLETLKDVEEVRKLNEEVDALNTEETEIKEALNLVEHQQKPESETKLKRWTSCPPKRS